MTPLASAIKDCGFQADTADQILASMLATVTTNIDRTLRGYGFVAVEFGQAAADGFYQAINSLSPAAAQMYVTVGMDLSLDLVRGQLDQIAAASTELAPVCAELKSLGRTDWPLWQSKGLLTAPDSTTVAAALAEVTSEASWQSLLDQQINPLRNDPTKTFDSTVLRSAVSAWGG